MFWIIVFSILIILSVLILIRQKRRNNVLMVVLGSGGHTGEMFSLLQSCFPSLTQEQTSSNSFGIMNNIDSLLFIISSNDTLSLQRISSIKVPYRYVHITRARDVHESLISAIPKIVSSVLQSFFLLFEVRPLVLLTNGPGVCVPLIIASRLVSPRTECIFVESVCRTRTLSLTGKILYKLRLVKHFFVQWPRLFELYPRSRYIGLLV